MTLSINIPFDGFYDSIYSSEIDHQADSWAENEADDREHEHPEHLRLDQNELAEIIWRVQRIGPAYQMITRAYVDAFEQEAIEYLGFPLGLKFEEMTSPREYNFETDRLFAEISETAVRKMFFMSKADGHKTLATTIKRRFTSCDGFISHYRNDIRVWWEKPLRQWDHNELGTLLIACFEIAGMKDDSDFRYAVFESVMYNDLGYQAFEASIDWPDLEERIRDAREEKAQAWAREHPDEPAPAQTFFPHPDQMTFRFYQS